MKSKPSRRYFLSATASSLLALSITSHAQTLFWDANGETTNTGGSGNWSDTVTWRSGSDTGTLGDWVNNSPAFFGDVGGTVTLTTGVSVSGLSFSTNYTLTGSTLTLATNGIAVSSGTATISSVIAGSAGLNKTGAGILTINGSAASTFTGGFTAGGGTLGINYQNFNGNNLIDSANSLTLSRSTFRLDGSSTSLNAKQTFSGTTLNPGFSTITLNRQSGTSVTLELGNVTREAGSVVRFANGTNWSNTGAASTTEIVKTTGVTHSGVSYSSAGYIGAGFIHNTGSNTRWVGINSSGQLVQGPNSIAWVSTGGSASSAYNFTDADRTLTGNTTMYGILATNATNSRSLTLGNFNLSLNGILHTQTGNLTLQTGEGGTGEVRIGVERDLVLIGANSGTITISAPIVDSSGGASSVTTSGAMTLSGANTFSGGLYPASGALTLNNNLASQNGALFTTGSGTITLGAGITTPTFGGLSGSRNLSSLITSGYGNVTALTLNPLSGTVTYDGVIANGAAGMTLTKTGSGTQILSGANTYSGATVISQGTLVLTGATQGTSAISFQSGGTGELGLSIASTVAASSATVNLADGKIRIIDTPITGSYTLLTAASITGTPVLAETVPGYILEVVGGNELRLVPGSPPSNPYATWAGEGVLFGDDANNDGVDNGLAFLLGASGPNVSALNKLPTVTQSAGALTLSFQMLDSTARGTASLAIQYSNSLATGSWTTVNVPASSSTVDDVVFTVTGTNPLSVTATIPVGKAAGGKRFGRLKATE